MSTRSPMINTGAADVARDDATRHSARKRTLVAVVDDHYVATPQGVFSRFSLSYDYWKQYLEVFDEVRPLSRVGWADHPDPKWHRADGPGVSFLPIPDFLGLWQTLGTLPRNLWRVRRALQQGNYFLLMGGNISTLAWTWLKLRRVPYARAVIGREGLQVQLLPHVRHPGAAQRIAELTHWLGTVQVAGACCTNHWARTLRESYPPPPSAKSFIVPEIELGTGVMTAPRPLESFCADPLRLLSVGRMNPEKGYRQLLDALKFLDDRGERRWTLETIGPGPELETLRRRAAELGLADRVTFPGLIRWGPDLFSRVDRADLYVLPSLSEGMPRAILEAMARGLPAIATRVGGLPEVLDASVMVPPGDVPALAALIRRHIGDRQRLADMSQDSFRRAAQFHPNELRRWKHAFWSYLRDYTDRWYDSTRRNGR